VGKIPNLEVGKDMMRALRKNLDVILIIVVVAFAVTIYYGYGSYRRSGRSSQAVAATVNDAAITVYDVDQAFRSLLSQYDSKTLSQLDEKAFDFLRRLTLENLINNELLYQEARSRRMRVSNKELQNELDRLKKSFPSEADFRHFLDYQRITLRDLQASLRRELLINKLLESLVSGAEIPEEEMQKYYNDHKDLFSTPSQYHLLRMTFASREEAEKALKRLYLGEDFAKVAKEVSLEASRAQGGDIGWVEASQIPKEAQEAIEKIKDHPKNVSPIIPLAENLFAIYRVLEWKPREEKTYEEVKEEIRTRLLAEQKEVKVNHLLAELRKKSTIAISDLFNVQGETPAESSSGTTPKSSPTPQAETSTN